MFLANTRAHEVKLKDLTMWLDRSGSTPKEVMDRKKIWDILQLPKLH